jgi:hypothetical protein
MCGSSWLKGVNVMKYPMALIVALLVPTAAMAGGECQADRQKFCKDVAKGDVVACLDKHSAELSEACKAKREARAKKNAEDSAKMGKEEGTHPAQPVAQSAIAISRATAPSQSDVLSLGRVDLS